MPERGYETSDVSWRWVAFFLSVLLAAALVIHAGLAGLVFLLEGSAARKDTPPSPLEERPRELPRPALQSAPARDLRDLREAERSRLTTYGWIDRERGVLRIPIDRAMDRLLEER